MRARKFLKTGIIVFLTIAFLLVPVFANAQNPGQVGLGGAPTIVGGGTPAASGENSCAGWTPNAFCSLVVKILHIPLIFSSWLLGLSGVVLNLVLKFSVIQMSENINGITGINIAWRVIRDITNMLFIFVLLYVAIQTILGLGSGSLKKTLVLVVVAALLINFSLFFTKVIIDASNLIALTFYERVAPGAANDTFGSGISNKYMEPLGLTSIFDTDASTGALATYGLDIPKTFIISVGGSIFLIITAFVFLAASLMFLIRYVNIIFLLILSPVFFLGLVLPGFGSNLKSKWAESLSSQAIFAPVFMILTWMVITIINSGNFFGTLGSPGTASNNAAGAIGSGLADVISDQTNASAGAFGLIVNFIIIIAFAIATLVISKMVANQGGSVGAKVVGGALGVGAGVAGWGARKSVGGIARKVADDEKTKEMAANKDNKYSRAAQMAALGKIKFAQRAAKSSFDIRGSKTLGALGGVTGFDMVKEFGAGKAGGKGGYDAIAEERAKKKDEFAETLEPSKIEKDKAKQQLEKAKDIKTSVTDEEYRQEYVNRKSRERGAQKEHEKAKAQFDEYQAGVRSGTYKYNPNTFKYHKDLAERKQKDFSDAQKKASVPVSELKQDMVREREEAKKKAVAEAQEKVDKFGGVSKGEADGRKKNLKTEEEAAINNEEASVKAKKLESEFEEKKKDIINELDPMIRASKEKELEALEKDLKMVKTEAEANIKQIKESYRERASRIKEVVSEGDQRKYAYAKSISEPGRISSHRVAFIGPVSHSSELGGAKIRKGKKPINDRLKELLKENDEIRDNVDEKSDDKTDSTPDESKKTT